MANLMTPCPYPLCLASESPRRAELLRKAGIPFTVLHVRTAELTGGAAPEDLVRINAERKAAAGALLRADAVVLAADTVVALDGKIYGKPHDLAEAAAFLRGFSGRKHEVLTGVALEWRDGGKRRSFTVTTEVWFKELSDAVIADYLKQVAVLDKAGAYALQEHGEMLIDRVEGDPDNVVGLPTAAVLEALRDFRRFPENAGIGTGEYA